jgi:hypothetical protein
LASEHFFCILQIIECLCIRWIIDLQRFVNGQRIIVEICGQFVIAHIFMHCTDVVENYRCVDAAFAFDSLFNFQTFVVIFQSQFVIAHIIMH